MIKTSPIKISSGKILRILFLEYGIIWGIIIFSIALSLGVFAAFFDYRWIVIALLWIFIITPLSIMFLYIIYGLRPLTAYNALFHSLSFDQSKVRIEFIDSDKEQSGSKKEIELEGLKKIRIAFDLLILRFEDSLGLLILPLDSFERAEDTNRIFQIISPYVSEHRENYFVHETRGIQ